MGRLRAIPELRDVNSDQQTRGLQAAVDATLNDAFGQRQVSNIYQGINQYHVVLTVSPEFQADPARLKDVYVPSGRGTIVPVSAFAHYELTPLALSVNHQGQSPAITLSFNLAPGVALGSAVADVDRAEREIGMPGTVHGSFQGTAQAFQTSLASEP